MRVSWKIQLINVHLLVYKIKSNVSICILLDNTARLVLSGGGGVVYNDCVMIEQVLE